MVTLCRLHLPFNDQKMKTFKISFIYLRICLWRVSNFIFNSIVFLIPGWLRNLLWRLMASEIQIQVQIENSLINSDGVIIQVGSNDGISNDPLYNSILKHKRKSFLVEPVDYLADKLRLLHKDNHFVTISEFAVHPYSDRVDFFYLAKNAEREMGAMWRPWYGQLGSFSKKHLIIHAPHSEAYIEKTSIACKTLNNLISLNNITSVSILHIDAEGYDLEVLSSIDLDQVKPNMIMIEHKHVNLTQLFSLVIKMTRLGYRTYVYHEDVIFILSPS